MSNYVLVKVPVNYSCGHKRMYRFASVPRSGDKLYCFECSEDVTVINVAGEHWVYKCRTQHGVGGKLFIRHFGKREKVTCEIAAAKHRARKGWQNHVVDIYEPGGALVRTFGDPVDVPTLPGV